MKTLFWVLAIFLSFSTFAQSKTEDANMYCSVSNINDSTVTISTRVDAFKTLYLNGHVATFLYCDNVQFDFCFLLYSYDSSNYNFNILNCNVDGNPSTTHFDFIIMKGDHFNHTYEFNKPEGKGLYKLVVKFYYDLIDSDAKRHRNSIESSPVYFSK